MFPSNQLQVRHFITRLGIRNWASETRRDWLTELLSRAGIERELQSHFRYLTGISCLPNSANANDKFFSKMNK